MNDSSPYVQIQPSSKGPIIFGQDVSQIPCFRNSWLYGISTGLFGGLVTFMGTSKPALATKSGFVCMMGTTIGYWIYCRYNWMQEVKTAQMLNEYIKIHEDVHTIRPMPEIPPSQPDLEVVTVANK